MSSVRGVIGAILVVVTAAAAGADAAPEAPLAPAAGNGALLVRSWRSWTLAVVEPGRRRPTSLRLRTSEGGGAAWSPDGQAIAVATPDGLVVLDVRARRTRVVGPAEAVPVWSPDGSRLAYAVRGRIWVKRLGARGARRFAAGSSPTWSPDGAAIAYRGRSGIFVTWLAGGTRRVVSDSVDPRCSVSSGDPDWSPDGRKIAVGTYYACANEWGEVSGYSEIATVPMGDGVGGVLAEGGEEDGPWRPIWSPNGRQVAFMDELLDENGSRPRIVTIHGRRTTTRLLGPWELLDWQPLCTVRGTSRSDTLRARPRADLVCGLRGDDRIAGGRGTDRLFGEDGNDRIEARDGEFDVVGCGRGRDAVAADVADLVGLDCERVARR